MNLYQSITKVTNFYLEDIQKAIENCEKQLQTIVMRIEEIENTINQQTHNPKEIKELLHKNHNLLAENCFFIEEQNNLIRHYQNALNIIKHKHLLTFCPTPSDISESIRNAFEEMLIFYKEKGMKENVAVIKNFLEREKPVFPL